MTDVQTEGLTFEKVWAGLMENREQIKGTEQLIKQVTQQMKETDKKIGELGNRFGELAEHLVAPNISEKFSEKGFEFTRMVNKGLTIKDPKSKKTITEIDILLESAEAAIAIEIKAKATHKDVDIQKERMAILRRWAADMYQQGSLMGTMCSKKIFGAIAGAIMTDEVKEYAQEAGFYTIEQSGDTVKIDVPEDFIPKNW